MIQAENDNDEVEPGARLFAQLGDWLSERYGQHNATEDTLRNVCARAAIQPVMQPYELLYDLFGCEALLLRDGGRVHKDVRRAAAGLQTQLLQDQGLFNCVSLLTTHFDKHKHFHAWAEITAPRLATYPLRTTQGMLDALETFVSSQCVATELAEASRRLERNFQCFYPQPWQRVGTLVKQLQQQHMTRRGAVPLQPRRQPAQQAADPLPTPP